jgi:hypothetical protein
LGGDNAGNEHGALQFRDQVAFAGDALHAVEVAAIDGFDVPEIGGGGVERRIEGQVASGDASDGGVKARRNAGVGAARCGIDLDDAAGCIDALGGRCPGDRLGGRPARSVRSGAASTACLSSVQRLMEIEK